MTDEELKKEAKNELKNDSISCIIKAAKCLVSRVPGKEETYKDLEIFRLRMILRLLQISSFNGKMNALNEVNKVIASVTYYPHRHTPLEEDEWLTPERMAVNTRFIVTFIFFSNGSHKFFFLEVDKRESCSGDRVEGFITSTSIC